MKNIPETRNIDAEKLTDLEKAILATIVYYDVFEMPLSAFEIWKYLLKTKDLKKEQELPSLKNIIKSVSRGILPKKFIHQKNGFYFLKKRSGLYDLNIERKKITAEKRRKTEKFLKIFLMAPFVQAVFLSGSLAYRNGKKESDIDFLVVSKYKRIWTSRFFLIAALGILGIKRTKNRVKDKVCLNHFISDKSLEISNQSIYNAQTYARLLPLIDKKTNSFYLAFQKQNRWLKDYLFNFKINTEKILKTQNSRLLFIFAARATETVLSGKLGDFVENALKKIQKNRIEKDPKTRRAGGRVVYNDFQLEFHPLSPEQNIIAKYNKKMKNMGLKELANAKDSGLN